MRVPRGGESGFAVGILHALCEGLGDFVPYKSGEIEEELEAGKRAVKILGGEVEQVEKFTLPGADASRSLIRIRKMKAISGKYPRKAGLPTKEPLH